MNPSSRASLLLVFMLGCGSSPPVPGDAGRPLDGGVASADAGAGDGGAHACAVTANGVNVVTTERGAVSGEATDTGTVVAFRGVPYAAPPTGERRFREPALAPCWTDVREAKAFGPACPQLDANGRPTGDEDCLHLNVWTRAHNTAERLPVLFFIHGGGNNQGSTSVAAGGVAIYDGRALAARGAVVVTVNYRLGALGFLAHTGLDAERETRTSGNWALHDLLAALAWVQRNIARFGGDPTRVMVFGESAGGANTCSLLASPRAAGLFARALVQSGGCSAMPRAQLDDATARLLTNIGCANNTDPIACLRAKTAAEILTALPANVTGLSGTDFNTSVDGLTLTTPPMEALRAGTHHRVPLLLGSNRDETARMLPPASQVATPAQYEAAARLFLSQFALPRATEDAVLAVYPASAYASPRAALVALTTDVRWTCPARAILRQTSRFGTSYRYFFTHTLDPTRAPALAAAGAYHGLELFYVFGTLEVAGYRPTDTDRRVADTVQRYWTRFAETGDPNTAGTPSWPGYSASMDPYIQLSDPATAGTGVRTAQCDALEAALSR